jgi:serine/threonine protein kinase
MVCLSSLQGFYYRSSGSKPRLEIFSELGCCLEDLMPDMEEREAVLGLGLVQKVMASLLGALDFLHGRGVVHR